MCFSQECANVFRLLSCLDESQITLIVLAQASIKGSLAYNSSTDSIPLMASQPLAAKASQPLAAKARFQPLPANWPTDMPAAYKAPPPRLPVAPDHPWAPQYPPTEDERSLEATVPQNKNKISKPNSKDGRHRPATRPKWFPKPCNTPTPLCADAAIGADAGEELEWLRDPIPTCFPRTCPSYPGYDPYFIVDWVQAGFPCHGFPGPVRRKILEFAVNICVDGEKVWAWYVQRCQRGDPLPRVVVIAKQIPPGPLGGRFRPAPRLSLVERSSVGGYRSA